MPERFDTTGFIEMHPMAYMSWTSGAVTGWWCSVWVQWVQALDGRYEALASKKDRDAAKRVKMEAQQRQKKHREDEKRQKKEREEKEQGKKRGRE